MPKGDGTGPDGKGPLKNRRKKGCPSDNIGTIGRGAGGRGKNRKGRPKMSRKRQPDGTFLV